MKHQRLEDSSISRLMCSRIRVLSSRDGEEDSKMKSLPRDLSRTLEGGARSWDLDDSEEEEEDI